MDNYEAIKNMDRIAMENFLDQVYLTGLNSGMYAAGRADDDEEQSALLDENPFSGAWLTDEAEAATVGTPAGDGDEYLLNALVTAIFRSAGIVLSEEDENDGDSDP